MEENDQGFNDWLSLFLAEVAEAQKQAEQIEYILSRI